MRLQLSERPTVRIAFIMESLCQSIQGIRLLALLLIRYLIPSQTSPIKRITELKPVLSLNKS